MRSIHPFDDYRLAQVVSSEGITEPGSLAGAGEIETDLFAGIGDSQ